MRAPELIQDFLTSLRNEYGAASVTMLMHMEPLDRQSILLISDDLAEPVVELADEEAAWNLISDWHEHQAENTLSPVSQVASEKSDTLLLRLEFDNIMARPKSVRRNVNERRSQPDINTAPLIDGVLWIAFVGCDRPETVIEDFQQGLISIDAGNAAGKHAGGQRSAAELVALAARLAWSNYQLTTALQDPVSQLPGRMDFQVFLKRAIAAAREHDQFISLLLVNPDDFSMINHRYGREQGDRAVREIADVLAHCLRGTDGVFRYGGAVFGVVLPATNLEQCRAAVEKVRKQLTTRPYLDEDEHLIFSMGAAVAGPEEFRTRIVDAADMLKSADGALNRAKLSGGGRVVVCGMGDSDIDGESLNPLGGIFTADTEKDYRNMLLLWETVGLVSSSSEPGAMARALVDRLATGFQPDRIALFAVDGNGETSPMAINIRDASAKDGRSSRSSIPLHQKQEELLDKALESKQVERLHSEADKHGGVNNAYAVPLIARDRPVGCLYLDGRGRRLALDSSDVIFLTALGSQMAVALDRAALAAGWIIEKDRESRQLREELHELKQSLDQSRMIYESEEMKALMDTLERVAPSNATVLITGESGTGKEMLAHSIHEFSSRSERPFVVFDCGAVAHSLLEAELFGHVKGAFTGAESASAGRIAQADGGTLFLDELGELPLQVQSKLLRFVQEKEFSPVGSAQSVKVDVRLVAATNRTLQDEVAAGRFRADLYYRLQVISLQAIPLRHRLPDVMPLANYFLERFAAQHGRRAAFSDSARSKLLNYEWPGNVRELQNCILRTILTAPDEVIGAEDIELLPESPSHTSVNLIVEDPVPNITAVDSRIGSVLKPDEAQAILPDAANDPWQLLNGELNRQVKLALKNNNSQPLPLGRWLTEDLVLAASDASNNIVRRAAARVGIPETTFRRHFQRASSEQQAGLANRTSEWEKVREIVRELIEGSPDENPDDLLERARLLLLDDVFQQVSGRISAGAALMGVTAPTYKRWLEVRH